MSHNLPAVLPALLTEETRLARQLAGGRVEITAKSLKTGAHLTFTVRARRPKTTGRGWESCTWADAVLVFVDESHTGNRVAMYRRDRQTGALELRDSGHSPRQAALAWSFLQVVHQAAGDLWAEDQVELRSADRCGCCFRKLTDPESIDRGIGPDCLGKSTASHYTKATA